MSLLTGHDIQIGEYHSARDFHLIPAKKCVVQPPTEKVISLNVPGMNGQADLSHSITGYPVFYEREGSWEFYSDMDCNRVGTAYRDIKRKLALQCQKTVKVILDDEPTFYYKGKVWMGKEPTSTKQQTKFTFNYRCYPFKYLVKPLEEDWLWDDFNFETDLAPQKLGDIILTADSPSAVVQAYAARSPGFTVNAARTIVPAEDSLQVSGDSALTNSAFHSAAGSSRAVMNTAGSLHRVCWGPAAVSAQTCTRA